MKREGLKWKKAKEFKVKKREIKINYCSGFLTYFYFIASSQPNFTDEEK